MTACTARADSATSGIHDGTATPAPSSSSDPQLTPTIPLPTDPGSAPPARVGTPAPSQRIRFVPEQVVLPGGATAPVLRATTVNGQLQVPAEARKVGWWDGGAEAGDPFGSVVLAGHVDTKTEGLGFFFRLRGITTGEVIVVNGSGHTASYRVESIVSVPKDALATKSGAFDQTGDHRLVLITCTGAYDASRGGYQENLVITATPIGLAR